MSYGPEGEAFFCDVCEDNPKRCNKIDCPGRDHPDDPHTQAKERLVTPPSHDAEIEHIRKRLSLSKPEYGFTSMAALYEAARTLLHILDARTEAAPETFGLTEYEELHARITAADPQQADSCPPRQTPAPTGHGGTGVGSATAPLNCSLPSAEAAPVVPVVPTPRCHTAECAIHTLGTIKSCNCIPVDVEKGALILELRRLIFRWDDDPNFAISDIADALLSSNILRPMPTWQPIETAPKGLKLLVGYANSLGNWRTVTATYYLPRTLEIDYADYNADDEDGYAKEGWYEETETHDTVMPIEGGQAPTHWQHLPPKPINPSTGDK